MDSNNKTLLKKEKLQFHLKLVQNCCEIQIFKFVQKTTRNCGKFYPLEMKFMKFIEIRKALLNFTDAAKTSWKFIEPQFQSKFFFVFFGKFLFILLIKIAQPF